jgi:hypothetical protein
MNDIKSIVEDLGNIAFENNIKIAAFAIISDLGELILQTGNWDLSNQTNVILNVIEGKESFFLNNLEFSINGNIAYDNGFYATSKSDMGYVLFLPFQGGVLVVFALPQANPDKALSFLKSHINKFNGKL